MSFRVTLSSLQYVPLHQLEKRISHLHALVRLRLISCGPFFRLVELAGRQRRLLLLLVVIGLLCLRDPSGSVLNLEVKGQFPSVPPEVNTSDQKLTRPPGMATCQWYPSCSRRFASRYSPLYVWSSRLISNLSPKSFVNTLLARVIMPSCGIWKSPLMVKPSRSISCLPR
jgi:hypothetical protein